MTSELLIAIAGVILSLVFEFFPKIGMWYNMQPDNKQRLIMLGVILAAALGVYGLSCAQLVDDVTCDKNGLFELMKLFIAGIIANQSTHAITPRVTKRQSDIK